MSFPGNGPRPVDVAPTPRTTIDADERASLRPASEAWNRPAGVDGGFGGREPDAARLANAVARVEVCRDTLRAATDALRDLLSHDANPFGDRDR
jgi:hypothetical protein